MAQQIIDFGAFPNDPAADPIRAAFAKVQNNFTDLYSATLTRGVDTITAGAGLNQNRTTGNVILSANISNVTIQTTNGLLVGVGAATGTSATIVNYATPFVIGLSTTISTTNISATNLTGTLKTASQPNITSLGTLVSLGVTGNVTASNFLGNVVGGQLSGIFTSPGSNTQVIFNNRGNLGAAANLRYTGTTLTLTGEFTATGNIIAGNVQGGNLVSANYFQGTFLGPAGTASQVSASAQPNITQVGTLTSLQVAGTLQAPSIAGNVTGNLLGTVTGNLVGTADNATTVRASAQPNITSLGTLTILNVAGNADIGNVNATFIKGQLTADASDQPNIRSLGILNGLSVSGNMSGGNISLTGNLTAGNMSVGIFSATSLSGNLSGNVTGNVTGNISGNVSGNLSGNISGNIGIPGQDTQLVFRDTGIANTHGGATYNRTTGLLSITANVSAGNLVSSGVMFATVAANVGRVESSTRTIAVTSVTYVGGRITVTTTDKHGLAVGNEINLTGITGTGITAGTAPNGSYSIDTVPTDTTFTYITTGTTYTGSFGGTPALIAYGTVTATGTIRGANLATNGFLSVTGNANIGNITTKTVTGEVVSVSGNVSGANLVASGVVTISGTSQEALAVLGGANLSGTVIRNGNVTSANVTVTTKLTTLDLSATGNLDGANISTSGVLTVTQTANVGNLVSQGSANITGTANVGNMISQGNANVTGTANVGAFVSRGGANVSGTANVGSLVTPGSITSIGNINANTAWINAGNINVSSTLQGASLAATNGLSVGGTANISHVVLPNITNLTIAAITYVGTTITVTTTGTHGMAVSGAQFTISGTTATTNAPNGVFAVGTVPATVIATVSSITYNSTTITVNTSAPHGMTPGSAITISGITATTNAPNGTFVIDSAPTSTQFTYIVTSAPTGSLAGTITLILPGSSTFTYVANNIPTGTIGVGSATLSIKPLMTSQGSGQFAGNLVSANVVANSGLFVSGTSTTQHLVSANTVISSSGITSMTHAGTTTVTVTTVNGHGMAASGATVVVSGAQSSSGGSNYTPNGTWLVASIVSPTQFTFVAAQIPIGSILVAAATITIVPLLTSSGSGSFGGALSVVGNASSNNFSTTTHMAAGGNMYANSGVIQAANTNITGTAGMLHVEATGNANFTGSSFKVTSTATFGEITQAGNVTSQGNVQAANLVATNTLTGGNLSTPGQLSVAGTANVSHMTLPTVTLTGGSAISNIVASGTTIRVTTVNPHGMAIAGASITVSNATAAVSNSPNGVKVVSNIVDANRFEYTVTVAPQGAIGVGASTSIVIRPLLSSAGSGSFGGALNVTGTATVGNIGTTDVTASGNLYANSGTLFSDVANANMVNAGNVTSTNIYANSGLIQAANHTVTNQLNTQHIAGNGNVYFSNASANFTVLANANIANISTTTVSATGNIVTTTGLVSSLNSNVTGLATIANANVTSNLNVVGTATHGNLSSLGILNVRGNANVGNVGMLHIAATGNINAQGSMNVAGTANVGNLTFAPTTVIPGTITVSYNSTTITFNSTLAHGLSVNNEVVVSGVVAGGGANPPNGIFLVASVPASPTVTTNRSVAVDNITYNSTTVTVTTTVPHQITGTPSVTIGGTTATTNPPNGTFTVVSVINATQFTYTVSSAPTGTVGGTPTLSIAGTGPNSFTVIARVAPTGTLSGTISVVVRPVIQSQGSGLFDGRIKVGGNAEILGSLTSVTDIIASGNHILSGNMFAGNIATAGTINNSGNQSVGANIITTGASSNVANGNSTVTFSDQGFTPFTVGQSVTITGITPIGFNGSKTILAANSTSITFIGTTGGPQTVAGYITGAGNLTIVGNHAVGGGIVAGGNLTITTSAQSNFTGNIGASHIFLGGNANAGNLNSSGIIFATGNLSAGTASSQHTLNGILNVVGNANVGNITTKGINGEVVTVSGNVSGANLISSGVLSVAGTANIGNLNLPSQLIGISTVTYVGTTITVTTTADHGLSTGAEITMTGLTSSLTNPPNINQSLTPSGRNPAWFVITVTGVRSFTYIAVAAPTGVLNYSAASLNARPYLTSTGSASYGGNITASGTVVATLFTGNGSSLSGITGGNVIGEVPNATYSVSAASATNAGVVTTAAQPNITSVGALINLAVNGNHTVQSNVAILTASGTGAPSNIATLTYANPGYVPFINGQTITVSGMVPAGYNGTFTVGSANNTTLTYTATASATGAMTSGAGVGRIVNGGATISPSGNINATYIAANGSLLTSINGSNVSKVGSATNADTVTGAAQTNITSLGTLTGLTISGDTNLAAANATNITASGWIKKSIGDGISAAGTSIGTATAMSKQINNVTGGSGGVKLPNIEGLMLIVLNQLGTSLNIYPFDATGRIEGLAVGAPYSLGAGARVMLVSTSATQWYVMTAVYG
jgi:hypothetical protein